jgi:hypothetical protein
MYKKPINYGMIVTVSDTEEILFRETLIVANKEDAEEIKKILLDNGLLRGALSMMIPEDYLDEWKIDIQIVPFKQKLVDVSELAYSGV